ncbi:MAG: hypothetical protein KJO51_05990, partial [Gramella sp.]|nr:hypothetical protein [Christiangramia sp.]
SIGDDNSPILEYELAEITSNSLPDEFELGRTYTIDVAYVLPTQCHKFVAIDASREGNTGAKRREIYIAAVASYVQNSVCTQELGNSGTSTFTILIDESEDYKFYFWKGTGPADEPIYDEVTVPVVETI